MVSCCGAYSSVVSRESHLSLSSQKHSQLGTYISVMSLTYQSSRMKASMSENLIKMGQEAARATKLQAAADDEWSLSTETHEKAGVDNVEGKAMHDKAEALFIKADEDKALAATEEAVADGEMAKAVGEQEQVVAHFA